MHDVLFEISAFAVKSLAPALLLSSTSIRNCGAFVTFSLFWAEFENSHKLNVIFTKTKKKKILKVLPHVFMKGFYLHVTDLRNTSPPITEIKCISVCFAHDLTQSDARCAVDALHREMLCLYRWFLPAANTYEPRRPSTTPLWEIFYKNQKQKIKLFFHI